MINLISCLQENFPHLVARTEHNLVYFRQRGLGDNV